MESLSDDTDDTDDTDLGDRALARKIRSGDKEAFVLLVRRYERSLSALVRDRLGSGDAVEDVLQETFMRAWSGLRTQEPRNLRAWLYQVARNRCSDYLRSPQRRERIVGAEDHAHREPPGSGGCTPAPVGGGRDRRLGGGAGAGATGAAGVLSGRNEHRRDSRPPSLSARNGQATAVPRPRPGAQRIGHHQNEEGHYDEC